VLGFQHRADAVRYLEEFKERLGKVQPGTLPKKDSADEFGCCAAQKRRRRGKGKVETFTFLTEFFVGQGIPDRRPEPRAEIPNEGRVTESEGRLRGRTGMRSRPPHFRRLDRHLRNTSDRTQRHNDMGCARTLSFLDLLLLDLSLQPPAVEISIHVAWGQIVRLVPHVYTTICRVQVSNQEEALNTQQLLRKIVLRVPKC
jgi:hypothetical protein